MKCPQHAESIHAEMGALLYSTRHCNVARRSQMVLRASRATHSIGLVDAEEEALGEAGEQLGVDVPQLLQQVGLLLRLQLGVV